MTRSIGLLLALASALAGQSFFNPRALGEVSPVADARALGLGGNSALSWLNPGYPVELDRTTLGLTALGAGALGRSAAGDRFIGNARPAGFNSAVPLPLGLRLRLGVDESFNQDFDTWADSVPGQNWRYHVTGRGGVYALRAGLAWSFAGTGCAGIEYRRLIGASRENWRFQVPGGYVSTDTVEVDYSANAVRAGLAFRAGRFNLGAAFDPGYRLTARSLKKVHGVVGESLRTRTLVLPWSVELGAGFELTDRLGIVAGAEYRPWSGIEFTDSFPSPDWGTRDAWRFSLGAEFDITPSHPLRVGGSWTDWYFGTAGAEPVSALGLHLGTSVPITGFGSIDIGAELARRTGGELAEYSGRLMFTLAYQEAWLRRTRRWGY